MNTTLCGIELEHPVINASGTFDAIAALRTFGDAVIERFPFSAFVSKTITVEPRQGNPPPRLWETAAGLINSIGLPNKGLDGYLEHDLPVLARAARSADRQRHGLHARRGGAGWSRRSAARDEVAGLELNVSCPNVESGLDHGRRSGRDRRRCSSACAR